MNLAILDEVEKLPNFPKFKFKMMCQLLTRCWGNVQILFQKRTPFDNLPYMKI